MRLLQTQTNKSSTVTVIVVHSSRFLVLFHCYSSASKHCPRKRGIGLIQLLLKPYYFQLNFKMHLCTECLTSHLLNWIWTGGITTMTNNSFNFLNLKNVNLFFNMLCKERLTFNNNNFTTCTYHQKLTTVISRCKQYSSDLKHFM